MAASSSTLRIWTLRPDNNERLKIDFWSCFLYKKEGVEVLIKLPLGEVKMPKEEEIEASKSGLLLRRFI